MINTNYKNAYKEVLVIINNLEKSDYDKIPREYIEFFSLNCNKDYEFEYDNNKTFQEQALLDETKYILFGIFEKFGATEEQKSIIKNFRNYHYKKIEEEKRKKYKTDDDLNRKESISKIEIVSENKDKNKLPIKVKQENFFKKVYNIIINKIKNNWI